MFTNTLTSEGATGIPWGLAPDDLTARRGHATPDNIVEMPQARSTRAQQQAHEKDERRTPFQVLEDLANAKVLSVSEAKALREDLIFTYKVYAEQADWFITNTNRRKETAFIWQSIGDGSDGGPDEYGILADFALDQGKSNPVIAQAVRGMVRTGRMVKVGAILGPRAWATMQFYGMNGGFGL